MVKRCFKCGATKPLDDFYAHSEMADGRLNKCKECTKRDTRVNYADKREQYSAYDAARQQTPERRARNVALQRRKRERDPVKDKARRLVSQALRAGRLARRPCETCGAVNVHAHHSDYFEPLKVKWLCWKHHAEAHGKVAVREWSIPAWATK